MPSVNQGIYTINKSSKQYDEDSKQTSIEIPAIAISVTARVFTVQMWRTLIPIFHFVFSSAFSAKLYPANTID